MPINTLISRTAEYISDTYAKSSRFSAIACVAEYVNPKFIIKLAIVIKETVKPTTPYNSGDNILV